MNSLRIPKVLICVGSYTVENLYWPFWNRKLVPVLSTSGIGA